MRHKGTNNHKIGTMKTKNKSLLGLCCFLLVTFTACEAKEPPVNTGLVESSTEYHITKIPISPRPYQWPIAVIVLFSFNDIEGRFNFVWHGFSKPTAPLM